MKLPESIRQYLGEWLTTQFACGYVRLDSDGRVVSWSGDIEKLGISQLHEGRAVSEQLIFTEGLLPSNEPSTYLPMVEIEGCRPLDVHLLREHDGYGLLLIDACSEKQRLTGYQQKVNEYALWKEKQHTSSINKIAGALGHDTSGNFFKACNIAALRLGPDEKFTLIGKAPDWLDRFCPDAETQPCDISPVNCFSFLGNFLPEAHDFWFQKKVGCLKSGIWTEVDESGHEHLLEATAVYTGQSKMPIQLRMIIKEALELLRASLPATVEIKQDLQSNAYVLADSTQLHQVVMNLCTNAGHAMVKEGGVLDIRLHDLEKIPNQLVQHRDITPGPYIEMTVKDNGAGMTKETLDRIFDPFFTTKKKGEGTGMGLSVVHGIIKSCKGDISVSSQIGQGTCFRIILPTVNPIEMTESMPVSALPRGTESILFIDDEPTQADLALKILPPLGYHVTAMTDSTAALKAFIKAPESFDIVVTDMYMPKTTGKGVAIEMLKIRPDIPIILCTGYSADLIAPTSMDQYFKAYLVKPFRLKELAQTIRNILDQSRPFSKKL